MGGGKALPRREALVPARPNDAPASPAGRPRGYFFLGKKLNLFSLSFLPRLASGPVMGGRGRLCDLTRMLCDSLMAVLTPCSQDSISSCRVGGSGRAKDGAPLGPFLREPQAKGLGSLPPAPCWRGSGPGCPTYLILAVEEPLAAVAQPRTKGFPRGHLCI